MKVPPAYRQFDAQIAALKRLSFAAQTTGGVAGPDAELQAAISEAEQALGTIGSMPMSSKEKQESFRARNAMLGLTEVRGIYLPPELHAELKAHAQKLAAKVKARTAVTEVLPAKGTLG